MSKYTLTNAEERNREHPATFLIPERLLRDSLEIGDNAKLIFQPEGDVGERMWVIVTQVIEPGKYKGEINNDPVVINAKAGDPVEFGAEHVISIFKEEFL